MTDIDSNDSSDSEFWRSFEAPSSNIKIQPRIQQANPSPIKPLKIHEKEIYEKAICNIRESKEEELRNLKVKLFNTARKEFNSKLNSVKEDYQKQIEELKETHANSRSIIHKKDLKISELSQFVAAQEIMIVQMRITTRKLSRQSKRFQLPIEVFTKEVDESPLKQQVETLKELCVGFKEDLAKCRAENEKIVEENLALKKYVAELEIKIATCTNDLIERLLKEKEEIFNELSKTKAEARKEVDLREELNERQMKTINQLQEELKLAKTVIKSPRYHPKAFEKLRELNVSREKVKDENSIELKKENKLAGDSSTRHTKASINYTFKEYKVFESETLKSEFYGSRSLSRSTKLEIIGHKGPRVTLFDESRKRLSKNSILYYKDGL